MENLFGQVKFGNKIASVGADFQMLWVPWVWHVHWEFTRTASGLLWMPLLGRIAREVSYWLMVTTRSGMLI